MLRRLYNFFVMYSLVVLIVSYRSSDITTTTTISSTYAAKIYSNDQIAKAQKYLQMKELKKMRAQGTVSYDDMKSFIVNGTMQDNANMRTLSNAASMSDGAGTKGYQKFLGKGSLDQRLRAVIAYKRETMNGSNGDDDDDSSSSKKKANASGLSSEEEEELDEMMEDDDDDSDSDGYIDDDEEEALYEGLIMQMIERNKLNEIKKNFLLDKGERSESITNDIDGNNTTASTTVSALNSTTITTITTSIAADKVDDDDNYTPVRSTWGVFQRPRDISKTYGGGRIISKQEMDRMDELEEIRLKKGMYDYTSINLYMYDRAFTILYLSYAYLTLRMY